MFNFLLVPLYWHRMNAARDMMKRITADTGDCHEYLEVFNPTYKNAFISFQSNRSKLKALGQVKTA